MVDEQTPKEWHPLAKAAWGRAVERLGRKEADLTLVHRGRKLQREAETDPPSERS